MRVSTKARMRAASVSGSSLTPLQKNRLADHDDAGIHEPGAGRARIRRQLARMVGVKRHIGRLAARLEGRDQVRVDPLRLDDGNAGVEADDLHVIDGGKPLHDLGRGGAARAPADRRR